MVITKKNNNIALNLELHKTHYVATLSDAGGGVVTTAHSTVPLAMLHYDENMFSDTIRAFNQINHKYCEH